MKTSHKEIHDGKKYEMVIATPSGCEAISLQKMDTLTAVRRDDLNLSRDPLEKKAFEILMHWSVQWPYQRTV